MPNQSDITSNCCNKPMTVSEGPEGTCCYICLGCKKACDPKQPDIIAEKVEEKWQKEYQQLFNILMDYGDFFLTDYPKQAEIKSIHPTIARIIPILTQVAEESRRDTLKRVRYELNEVRKIGEIDLNKYIERLDALTKKDDRRGE